jgi:hypothetical protein
LVDTSVTDDSSNDIAVLERIVEGLKDNEGTSFTTGISVGFLVKRVTDA